MKHGVRRWLRVRLPWLGSRAATRNAVKWAGIGVEHRNPPVSDRILRKLPQDVLDAYLHLTQPGRYRIGIEREARRREAWNGPAGRAYRVSIIAAFYRCGVASR